MLSIQILDAGIDVKSRGLTKTMNNKRRNNKVWVPTPDEIRKGCLQIQAAWTETETESRKRRGEVNTPVSVVTVNLDAWQHVRKPAVLD